MAHDSMTINVPTALCRWTYPIAITTSDTNATANLQVNGRPYKYLQNVGTGGKVMIFWANGTTVDIYLGTGQEIEGGLWVHARTTGTGAGVDLRGFIGFNMGGGGG